MDFQGHGHIFVEKKTIPAYNLSDLESNLELRKLFNSYKVVYSELMFDIQDEICFTIIYNALTEFFPYGNSRIAWKIKI